MAASGNSVALKSFQSFTVNEGLLAKVVEAIKAGEKDARSSGDVKSFEVFYKGFRQNISIGRIFIVPSKVCDVRNTFPIALLYGTVVREFNLGEETADLITNKIGDTEFDEYSQADYDTIKTKIFLGEDGKPTSLVLFAPNWSNIREYHGFKFVSDDDQLSNLVRHLVFSAYFNPAVSSAFNALMTTVDTNKLDLTDVTPRLTYPFITENPLRAYPDLVKQGGWVKEKIFLTAKTADAITQEVLDPQELNVFEALDAALTEATMPETEAMEDVADYKGPDGSNHGNAEIPEIGAIKGSIEVAKEGEEPKVAADGDGTELRSRPDYGEKGSFTQERNEESMKMGKLKPGEEKDGDETKKRCKSCGAFLVKGKCPVSAKDCGRNKKAADESENSLNQVPVGIELDETGLPVHEKFASNLESTIVGTTWKVFSKGLLGKEKIVAQGTETTPQEAQQKVRDIMNKSNEENPNMQSKFGPSSVMSADKAAALVAAALNEEIGDDTDAESTTSKAARQRNEDKLNRYATRKNADVELTEESIWKDLTEDFGPAPVVELPGEGSAPSYSESDNDSSESSEPAAETKSETPAEPKSEEPKAETPEPKSEEPVEEKSEPAEEKKEGFKSKLFNKDKEAKKASLQKKLAEKKAELAALTAKAAKKTAIPGDGHKFEGKNAAGDTVADCNKCGYLYGQHTEAKKKKADDVSADISEAKSKVENPDTLDSDIHQPTVGVEEAAKVSSVESDIAEAHAKVVSPDTVDSDIQQPTVSVPEAAKVSSDVSSDIAEAKSETVSPDTVDSDIKQPTESVEEASKTAELVPDATQHLAQQLIESGSDYVRATAADLGANFDDVRNMPWFQSAVATLIHGFEDVVREHIAEAAGGEHTAAAGDENDEAVEMSLGFGDLADLAANLPSQDKIISAEDK